MSLTDYSDLEKEISDLSDLKLIRSEHKYELLNNVGSDGLGDRDYGYCHATRFASVIAANNCLYACCHLRNTEKGFIGDLSKTSLEEL